MITAATSPAARPMPIAIVHDRLTHRHLHFPDVHHEHPH